YAQIDELHVISSLAGFEALMRGVPVTAWGMPFYAGWGLTSDRASCPRRTRRLTVPELVAGALILYPRYVDPVTLTPCPAEDILGVIAGLRKRGSAGAGGGIFRRGKRFVSAHVRRLLG